MTENSLRIANATCVKDKESKPCSMNVAEVLICERSCPETGTSKSIKREAMRSLREDNEFPGLTLSGVRATGKISTGRSEAGLAVGGLAQAMPLWRGLPKTAAAERDRLAKGCDGDIRWRRKHPNQWIRRFAR